METPDFDYEQLDPGIRHMVRMLRNHGFDTCDSGDGHSKGGTMECALTIPHVFMRCERSILLQEADRLYALLTSLGASGFTVEATYDAAPNMPPIIMLLDIDDTALARAVPQAPN